MRERSHGTSPEEALRTLEVLNARAEARQDQARRRRRRVRWAGLAAGVLLVLGLVAGNVVIWGGYVDIRLVSEDSAIPNSPSVASTPPTTARASKPSHPAVATPPPTAFGEQPSTPARPGPAIAHVTFRITAVRGASWLMVRRSSPAGAVVFSGILSEGKSFTARGNRLWVRFGALGNLDLVLNGKAVRPAHTGTIDAVVTPNGLSS